MKDFPRIAILGLLMLALAPAVPAENIDPDDQGASFAWAENVGWINAEPSGDGGPGVEVSDFTLSGWMWSENVGWISLSCQNTGTCGSVNYGVKNDGQGTLTGRAWSEGAGWISFGGAVTIDTTSGVFQGEAWAENVGWIRFSGNDPVVYGVKTGWCGTVAAAPSGIPTLTFTDDETVVWSAVANADWYEAIGGTISNLVSSGGDYSAATGLCVGDNTTGTSGPFNDDPPPGEAFWVLVRPVNCKGKGSYDSDGAGQAGLRDIEIAASGSDCP